MLAASLRTSSGARPTTTWKIRSDCRSAATVGRVRRSRTPWTSSSSSSGRFGLRSDAGLAVRRELRSSSRRLHDLRPLGVAAALEPDAAARAARRLAEGPPAPAHGSHPAGGIADHERVGGDLAYDDTAPADERPGADACARQQHRSAPDGSPFVDGDALDLPVLAVLDHAGRCRRSRVPVVQQECARADEHAPPEPGALEELSPVLDLRVLADDDADSDVDTAADARARADPRPVADLRVLPDRAVGADLGVLLHLSRGSDEGRWPGHVLSILDPSALRRARRATVSYSTSTPPPCRSMISPIRSSSSSRTSDGSNRWSECVRSTESHPSVSCRPTQWRERWKSGPNRPLDSISAA